MNTRRCSPAVVFAVVALACSSDGGGAPSPDLVGSWTLTRYEFVSKANSSTRVDLIALGGTANLVLKSDGTWQSTLKMPDNPSETVSGTWSASSDVLTMTQVGMSGNIQFDYVLSGSTLTLSGADAEYDFNGDGADEPAKLDMTATKG